MKTLFLILLPILCWGQDTGPAPYQLQAGGAASGNHLFYNGSAWGPTDTVVLASGRYTPTVTNISNADSNTPSEMQYMRVGNTVTVSGGLMINATTATTATIVDISLPIASNFTADHQCVGTGGSKQAPVISGVVYANDTDNRATYYFRVGSDTDDVYYYIYFTYYVL